MDKIITEVYETRDYDKFKKMKNNRGVKKLRFSRLLKSFSVKEIMNPVIVNRNFEIVDGQGRFEVKKVLNRPIYYIIDPDASIDDCRRMNEYNAPWAMSDFVESYAEDGNQNYINLMKLHDETGVNYSRLIRLGNRVARNAHNRENLVNLGKLVFTEENYTSAKNALKNANDIIDALAYTRRPNEAFYTAVKIAS